MAVAVRVVLAKDTGPKSFASSSCSYNDWRIWVERIRMLLGCEDFANGWTVLS